MSAITPRFNFSPHTGEPTPGPGQQHASVRTNENLLSPYVFNEYERVMCAIVDALGDVDYQGVMGPNFGTYGGQVLQFESVPEKLSDSVRELARAVKILYENKLGAYGGTITGSLTMTGSGEYPLTVTNKVKVAGLVTEWAAGIRYTSGSIVTYEGVIYQCITPHTASSFYSDVGYWKPLSETGGNRFIITVPENYVYEFSAGDVITYKNGYEKAIADVDEPFPIGIVVRKLSPTVYLIAQTGLVEFDTDVFTEAGVYYLSSSTPGKVTNVAPPCARPIYSVVSERRAFVLLSHYRVGTYLEVEEFTLTENGMNDFELRFTPASKDFLFVTINSVLQQPSSYTLNGNVLHIVLDPGQQLYRGDVISVRYFYGNEITSVNAVISGHTVGNEFGNVPVSNGTRNAGLNADLVDGYHVGNRSGEVPLSNGSVNTSLNADMVDSKHVSENTSLLPGTHGYVPTQRAVIEYVENTVRSNTNTAETIRTVTSGDVQPNGRVTFMLNAPAESKANTLVTRNGLVLRSNLYDIDGNTIVFQSGVVSVGDTIYTKCFHTCTVFEKQEFITNSGRITAYHDGTNGIILNSSGDLYIDTIHPVYGINGGCIRSHGKIYNAVWNDYADFWPVENLETVEPGYCYADYGRGLTTPKRRADRAVIGIVSDTYGQGMGYDSGRAPIAVAGFVLAHVDRTYQPGTPLVSSKSGILTKARWYEILLGRVIATYVRPEPRERFNITVIVNGRHWVKVK